MERLTYTVSEVAQLLGISRSKAYDLVAEGLIPIVPLAGRRKLVARVVLQRLIEAASGCPLPDDETHDQHHDHPGARDDTITTRRATARTAPLAG